jgi:molecular chaperone GrpE
MIDAGPVEDGSKAPKRRDEDPRDRGDEMADESKKPEQETAADSGSAPAKEAGGTDARAADAATLEAQVVELTDRLLRAHAEMDNLRKRTERDKEDMAKYAISKFAREVLSVGDNLQRAIAAVPAGAAEEDPALKALIDGVSMTEREFLNVLERHGIRRLDPSGEPFNPHEHQAMTEVENREVAPGTVVQVYQPGYMLEDRVLRPAMVVVAKGGVKPGKDDKDDKPSEGAADRA